MTTKTPLKLYKLWFSLACFLTLMIIYLSLAANLPNVDVPFDHIDKVEHLTAYAVLMGWWGQLFDRSHFIKIAIALAAMGIVLEYAQSLTGYRTLDYIDALANTTGIFIGFALLNLGMENILAWFEEKLFK